MANPRTIDKFHKDIKEVRLKVPKEFVPQDFDMNILSDFFKIIHEVQNNQASRTQSRMKNKAPSLPSQQKVDAAENLVSILYDHQDELEDCIPEDDLKEIESLMIDINSS